MKLFAVFEKIVSVLNGSIKNSKPTLTASMSAHKVITEGFSAQELTEFYALGVKETFEHGQIIFKEDDAPDTFHIILDGEADVYITKTNEQGDLLSHVLATLHKDDVMGDMALVENKPRSASIRAKTSLTVLTFNMENVKANPRILLLLTRNMAKILSERLRFTNQVTVKKMEESLEQAQARNVLGVFMVAMLWLVTLYTLSLTTLLTIKKHLSNTTFLSVGLILFFTIIVVSAMRLTGLPLSRFGITWKDGPKKVAQALVYSVPVLLIFLVIKFYFVYFSENPQHIRVFSGLDEGILDGHFNLGMYLSVVFLYAMLCPVQELVSRSALQSTFFNFIPGNESFRKWNAILLSNLIFSAAHSHLSLAFASLTFVSGLFWGGLFHKQRSLLAVSASHILIGVWVVFIVGTKGMLYG